MTAHPKALFLVGTASGCGKTSVALGLMRAFSRQGLTVQGFKAGPDFIDPGLHCCATGRPSHNLDTWMLSAETIRSLVSRASQGCDLVIIEGSMGLFDGIGPENEQGSSAHLAKILGLPVTLVLNSQGLGRSVAAVVKGYAEFDPTLDLRSVIFNMTGRASHGELLRQAVSALPVSVLGCLPRKEHLHLPSRHLGLVTATDMEQREERLNHMADWVQDCLDLDSLFTALPPSLATQTDASDAKPHVRLGYALDQAFCFYYAENLRLLRQAGAELIPFSPLADKRLPENLNGLYLGGGYPELHAAGLAANKGMREEIHAFCQNGKPVYAECGGFMYLMRALHAEKEYPMCGVFEWSCVMEKRYQALGYREIVLNTPCLLGTRGERLRGHEFHYSRLLDHDPKATPAYHVFDRHGQSATGGYQKQNCLASYVHLHFASQPQVADHFVQACTTGDHA